MNVWKYAHTPDTSEITTMLADATTMNGTVLSAMSDCMKLNEEGNGRWSNPWSMISFSGHGLARSARMPPSMHSPARVKLPFTWPRWVAKNWRNRVRLAAEGMIKHGTHL